MWFYFFAEAMKIVLLLYVTEAGLFRDEGGIVIVMATNSIPGALCCLLILLDIWIYNHQENYLQ